MASPIDKYAHDAGSKSPAWDDLPPDPAAPMLGADAVLQLYAPKDNTMLDLGAGKRSGIRMVTDEHVHLTARGPCTTISLGAPGGDGINDHALGLQIYTAAEKRETIDGPTEEWYKNKKTEFVKGVWTARCEDAKTEYVKGVWNQTCDNAKTETVAGTVTEDYKSEHHLTVGKQAVHRFLAGKVDSVAEDWVVDVKGHKKEKVHGNKLHFFGGDLITVTQGCVNEVILGEKTTAHILFKGETNVGGTLTNTIGPKVTYDVVKVEKTSFKTQQLDVVMENAGVALGKVGAEIKRYTTNIVSSDIMIIKG